MSKDQRYPWENHYPAGIDWRMDIPAYPVYQMLDETAEKFGSSPGFDFLGFKYTWGEINDLTKRFAKGMQDMGVSKGTKVGIFLPNCPYFVIAYYALMRIGATVVNYNPLYAEKELATMIEDSDTDIMITADLELLFGKMNKMLTDTRLNHIIVCRFTDILPFPKNILFKLVKGKELADIPDNNKRITWYSALIDNKGDYKPVEINAVEDVALFQYTGGTTGVPKGAMLTHANIVANAEQASTWLGCDPGQDKMLGVLPFFHVFAMTAVMNMSVKKAMEIIALPRFDLDQTLALIDKKKPTVFPAVPAIINGINNHKKLSKFDLSSIKYCISGGAPLAVEVKKRFEKTTGCVAVEGYGLTESSPVVCCNPRVGENKAGSIGLPFPQTVVEILDIETGKPVAVGERGELCATGPQIMKGYWKRDDATASTLKNGRLHTGDIAIMDEQGYVFIVDRIKDMIITNGYNVYPRNVEEAIYEHPSVEECIVAGLPDAQRGEIVKAWIKCKEGRTLNAEDLKAFLADKISSIEIPKRIEFRDKALPKTMIGKLSRKDIIEEELGKK
ncbi:MAG: long-chain fatty acid--CoA ligase [Alphaproteobacteria bacterium]|nr:long-chain fatty acid--CoA ligase [Alphaproteobacteria bacterium]NCQ89015.1 long-chain fatty acid--CoA ligase [Alphaproteobacteria bacterium]NCT07916.1 long-chain fatty acid--CoA ligase [Alphaproteobacteria bacterium]